MALVMEQMVSETFGQILKRLLEERHTFGTQSLINGAGLRETQSLLGHSTLTMTLRYVATVNSEQAVLSHKKFSPVDRMLKP